MDGHARALDGAKHLSRASGQSRASRIWKWFKAFLPETPVGVAFLVVASALTIAVAFFDPFGLGTRTETSFQAASDRVWEAFYPAAAAQHIALITPTYDEVARGDVEFPISDGTLANAVTLARLAKARAIFLDYEFIRTATAREIAELTRAVKQAHDEKIPVFSGPISYKPEYRELANWVEQIDISRDVTHNSDYNLEPLGKARSAAASLYLALCAGPSALPGLSCDRALSGQLARRAPHFHPMPRMALQLGATYPANQAYYSGKTEAGRCRRQSWLHIIASGLKGDNLPRPCSNYTTIPFSFLTDPDARTQMIDDLRGRAVIIGAGSGLGDDHDWPGVGALPGVVFHAAALDNLLTYGHGYRRWPDDFPGFGHIGADDTIQLFAIILTPLLVLGLVRHFLGPQVRSKSEHRIDKIRHPIPGSAWWAMAILVGAMVIPAAAAYIFAKIQCWPPAPALIIVVVALPLTTTLTGDELGVRLEPFNTRLAALILVIAPCAALALLTLPLISAICLSAALFILAAVFIRPPTVVRRYHWLVGHLFALGRPARHKSS